MSSSERVVSFGREMSAERSAARVWDRSRDRNSESPASGERSETLVPDSQRFRVALIVLHGIENRGQQQRIEELGQLLECSRIARFAVQLHDLPRRLGADEPQAAKRRCDGITHRARSEALDRGIAEGR